MSAGASAISTSDSESSLDVDVGRLGADSSSDDSSSLSEEDEVAVTFLARIETLEGVAVFAGSVGSSSDSSEDSSDEGAGCFLGGGTAFFTEAGAGFGGAGSSSSELSLSEEFEGGAGFVRDGLT